MAVEIEMVFRDHLAGEKFRVQEIEIRPELTFSWVQVLGNPIRFVPEVFTGMWAAPNKHPRPGNYRVLAVVDCADGLARAVIRDGRHLFATPFI